MAVNLGSPAPLAGPAGALGGDERQYISGPGLIRWPGDHREEHLQVIRCRQHGVRPARGGMTMPARWFRELRTKDLFGAPSASQAGVRLKDCSELLEEFAERVFEARDQS